MNPFYLQDAHEVGVVGHFRHIALYKRLGLLEAKGRGGVSSELRHSMPMMHFNVLICLYCMSLLC